VYFQPISCNTHAEYEWAQETFLRQRRKVPPAHVQQVYLEEPIRLPSPHRINFSVCLSVRPSVPYENTENFHVGIKIRVSTWSFFSVVYPLQIPIPMCKKKIWVQQENSYKISYLFTCISNLILAILMQSMNGYEEPF
jgi:hypothetical protein